MKNSTILLMIKMQNLIIILLQVLQWFRYIIGKKILIKCANVLPVLRNFFCFQAIILCQFIFLQFYKFKFVCYSSGFSVPCFLNLVVCKQNRQTVLHQQEMKVWFWTDKSDLGLLLTETKLRITDRLRNVSIF